VSLGDTAGDDGVFATVRDGYDAVYDVLGRSALFNRIWRTRAYGGDFPEEFAHISFLTLSEGRQMLASLALHEGLVLADVACGAGGPGLWVARESGASLVGIDPAAAGLASARRRARDVGLEKRCRFREGTFERTGLRERSVDAVMSVEAFQYAPDKRAALAELFQILRPGRRLALMCFEVDPCRSEGLPVLGVDPVANYQPLLEEAGFVIHGYDETAQWEERVYGAFEAIIDARDDLVAEMGEQAAAGPIAVAMVTVQAKPYPRRVLATASRPA
jgi:SAM-dependent methyltransferase